MNLTNILISPPAAFLIFLAFFGGLYWFGSRMAPKLKKVGDKLSAYACGEDMPVQKIQTGYRLFFSVALFFTMMHVSVLVVATTPHGSLALIGLFYLLMIFLSVMALITRTE
jgi:NADH:ubiquinone oxidoreductase subunit 3 (subunit A)